MYNDDDVLARIMRNINHLEYNFDFPNYSELTYLEQIALIEDYDEYVQECFHHNRKPYTHKEFISNWNLIFNADLNKLQVGNYVYYQVNDNAPFVKYQITSKYIKDKGIVTVTLSDLPDDYISGELYKKKVKWC